MYRRIEIFFSVLKVQLIFISAIFFGSTLLYNLVARYEIKKICQTVKYNEHKKNFVFIGDSFLIVKPRLHEIFNNKIRYKGREEAVLNLSEPGIGPFDYYYKLNNAYNVIKNIDYVIIVLYLGNDILEVSNVSLKYSFYINLRFMVKRHFPGVACVTRGFKNAISNIAYVWRSNRVGVNPRKEKAPKFLKISPETYNRVFLIKDDEAKEALRRTERLLLSAHKIAKRNNTQILFVLVPPAFQVDERYFSIFEYDDKRLDKILAKTDKMQTEFKEFFEKNGIDYIDLLEPFRENRFRNRLYGLNDDHWDIDAITITADILAEKYHGIIK